MNKYALFSLFFLIAGFVFLFLGFLTGDIEAGFFFIFPFIIGSGIYGFLGIILLFLSFLMFIFSLGNRDRFHGNRIDDKDKKSNFKGGGVVLIGPIPIVFGSNWKIALVLMLLSIFIIFFMLYFTGYI